MTDQAFEICEADADLWRASNEHALTQLTALLSKNGLSTYDSREYAFRIHRALNVYRNSLSANWLSQPSEISMLRRHGADKRSQSKKATVALRALDKIKHEKIFAKAYLQLPPRAREALRIVAQKTALGEALIYNRGGMTNDPLTIYPPLRSEIHPLVKPAIKIAQCLGGPSKPLRDEALVTIIQACKLFNEYKLKKEFLFTLKHVLREIELIYAVLIPNGIGGLKSHSTISRLIHAAERQL
jgi:hypothetical protein